ncbi:MAG: indole-3-glycerol phosphate synthase TrpC [Planctomycetota bacterium]
MASILDEIVVRKKREIAAARLRMPFEQLEQALPSASPPRGFLRALKAAQPPALIAEVKKASPSAGLIRADFDPAAIAADYEAAGAACLSVLTDEHYFQGSLKALQLARTQVRIPVLRKEFIVDRYQVAEARVAGADCILLIAECLDDEHLRDLHNYARELGMDVLVELHDAHNLPRVLASGARLVGVNNRDLRTFATSLEHTFSLRQQIPSDVLLVSESGIGCHADIQRLRAAGVGAVLVGESLMRQPDIQQAVRTLLHGDTSATT